MTTNATSTTSTSTTTTTGTGTGTTAGTVPTVALVTGGNRGLGRSTVLALAARGTDVVLTYRSNAQEAADVVAEVAAVGRTAVALPLDTTQVGSFEAFAGTLRDTLAQTWGRDTVDVLVNNAGSIAPAPFAETTVADLDAMLDVHVRGPFFLTQTLLPLLADGGHVVNLSTGLTRFVGVGSVAYATAKGAVEVWTRYLAQELGSRGIRVNAVAPGAIATDFGGGRVRDNDAYRTGLAARTALGRVGQPEDIGPVVAAVASDELGWVTGQRIEASGGMFL